MSKKKDVEDLIDKAAKALATSIGDKECPVAEKTNALKALTQYYSIRFKAEAPTEQTASSGPNFASFQEEVSEADDGKTELRARN